MSANLFSHQAIAWLLTYLLHSTLLLSIAWLASKPLGRWSVAAEEAVWKLALVGALFTASLQLAAGWEPAAGRWSLPRAAAPAAVVDLAVPAAPVLTPTPILSSVPRPEALQEMTAAAAPRSSRPSIPALALGAWMLGSCLLLAGYSRSHLRLRSRLKNRP